jgi:hypothetical protein
MALWWIMQVNVKFFSVITEICIGVTLNDLWIYDGGNWTWMSGSNSTGQLGSYGDKGVTSPSNVPGARYGAIGWRDNDGNLLMLGGLGRDETQMGITKLRNITITFCVRLFE